MRPGRSRAQKPVIDLRKISCDSNANSHAHTYTYMCLCVRWKFEKLSMEPVPNDWETCCEKRLKLVFCYLALIVANNNNNKDKFCQCECQFATRIDADAAIDNASYKLRCISSRAAESWLITTLCKLVVHRETARINKQICKIDNRLYRWFQHFSKKSIFSFLYRWFFVFNFKKSLHLKHLK